MTILSTHNTLQGYNFAGLPYRFTKNPIHILDNIKKDAQYHRNQLWILFQDMSKAYDRVNLGMLQRALLRLQLPAEFVNLIFSLFAFRTNRVFTAHGTSPTYSVLSGIDQGEIISPILWCIYFDPLLYRAQDIGLGYQLHVDSPLPHMDDTLWLSNSKIALNQLMDIADSFYTLNSIQVNWTKSTLFAPLKNQNLVHFQLASAPINLKPVKFTDSVRYLGIWFSMSHNKQFIQQQVQQEIHTACKTLMLKSITDKQIIYIFNIVILPRLLYRTQLTFLGQKFCDRMMGSFRKILRTKLLFPKIPPFPHFIHHSSITYLICSIHRYKTRQLYLII